MIDKKNEKENCNVANRTIFCADNLDVLNGMNSESVDLIYLDPPFNKKKEFTAPIGSEAEGASFKDIWQEEDVKKEWIGIIAEEYPLLAQFLNGVDCVGHKSNKYYLTYMAMRLLQMHRILKPTGSIYLHCDPTLSHSLKMLMDTIFGGDCFHNEIVWCFHGATSPGMKHFARKHNIIFWYSKDADNYVFNVDNVRLAYSPLTIKRSQNKTHKGKWNAGEVKLSEGGKFPEDWWHDIKAYQYLKKVERLGYPTQKPLALLERIILASSNAGDVILDPFCGCATTCVAAEKLERKWVGIDISPMAYHLVKQRFERELVDTSPILIKNIIYRDHTAPLVRTDVQEDTRKKVEIKHELYGLQDGICAGCKIHFEYKNLTVDHILPKVKGGLDNIENLQLLCGHCNSIKGDRDMTYLTAKLREYKIIK